MATYNSEDFRRVNHGVSKDGYSFHCRMCKFSDYGKSEHKGRKHAQETGHTVDVYREHWVEFTSHKK
jgi:hypothetical protein